MDHSELSSSNPSINNMTSDDDMIIFAEFSELEGPLPLLTVPAEVHGWDWFDINAFVLRIMSVDHQSQSAHGTTFEPPKDTQVVLTEGCGKVVAYVHHFTLHDVSARGYVRPFCLAYVTTDVKKPMTFFPDLLQEFSRVTTTLKLGNRLLFYADIERRMMNLRYTHSVLLKMLEPVSSTNKNESGGISTSCNLLLNVTNERGNFNLNLRNISDAEASHSFDIDSKVEASLRANSIPELLTTKEAVVTSIHELEILRDSVRNHINSKNLRVHFLRKLVCWEGIRTVKSNTEINKLKSFPLGPASSITDFILFHLNWEPCFLHSLQKTSRFEASLRSPADLCNGGYREALNILNQIHTTFRRSFVVIMVERRLSCFNHNTETRLVRDEEAWSSSNVEYSVIPPPNTISASSSDVAGKEESYSFFGNLVGTSVYQSASSSFEFKSVLSDFESSLPHELTDIAPTWEEGTCKVSTSPPVFGILRSSVSDLRIASKDSLKKSKKSSSFTDIDDQDTHGDRCLELPIDIKTSEIKCNGVSLNFSNIADVLYRQNLTSGLLAFRNSFSFAEHVVFAILKGRSVFILASPEKEKDAQSLVTTLALFVPSIIIGDTDACDKAIVPWLPRHVCFADLATIKLAAIPKSKGVMPTAVERHASIIDLDNETLYSVPYVGTFVDSIMSRRKQWFDESTMLAHIHTQLYAISSKAFVYFHMQYQTASTCNIVYMEGDNSVALSSMTSPTTASTSMSFVSATNAVMTALTGISNARHDQRPLHPAASTIHKPNILSTMDIRDGDVEIIEYWTSILRRQHENDYMKTVRSSFVAPPIIHLCNAPCRLFRNFSR